MHMHKYTHNYKSHLFSSKPNTPLQITDVHSMQIYRKFICWCKLGFHETKNWTLALFWNVCRLVWHFFIPSRLHIMKPWPAHADQVYVISAVQRDTQSSWTTSLALTKHCGQTVNWFLEENPFSTSAFTPVLYWSLSRSLLVITTAVFQGSLLSKSTTGMGKGNSNIVTN